ncbi:MULTISPECIES: efflux RND transporter periplasmic adaptor subunit [unclassified Pedobacter]|uniref:efflux RND transporter periplasmic adaptor subunit n=1 Tax=Pedobacter TaxID=84567 RepID=UPI000B4A7BF2|nr:MULTISPECIES: efflux RND transporter periplasmic adaptor subunit [unclassified Pedobacter]MCX2432627.1 efflux RND transporter periplasmic adaptor subunit [Pedobacter sp. GR22-10]MCX2583284.1 efflux RND transporter periplasmic adaptor subunit [Pedobacter sp. MR22-3]OWK70126.1 efflux transporter periplasmic adaptor subunit [Pedobacter sp. AJM]
MKLKHILITIGVIIAILIGLKLAGVIGGDKTEKVTTEKANTKNVVETVTASGKIQPETEVKLSSEVSGEVVELKVKEGDIVKAGQLLCKVRPDILQSGYERSVATFNAQKASVAAAQQQLIQNQANFVNAEATYKRNVELFQKKVISASEFDSAKAAYLTAKATLASAKESVTGAKFTLEQTGANVKEAGANLARTTIYAPADGVVSKLSIELGDRILGTSQMAGTEIMRISNLSSMEVNVDVNENDITRVKVGDKAAIEVDAFSDKKFRGIVTEIASSSTAVGTTTGTSVDQVTNFSVKIRITEVMEGKQQSIFRPGMSATVDIESASVNGLAIPIQAVFTESGKNADQNQGNQESADKQKSKLTDKKVKQFVYTYDAKTKKVKKAEVTTGIQNDQFIIVKSGLKAGQEIVTGPYSAIQNKLKDGMIVEKTAKDQLFSKDGKK